MSGYLDRLERQLVDAARAEDPERRRRAARRRTIPAGTGAAAAVMALLVASAVALAVTGTFSTGSAVRPPVRPVASAGAGIAARGTRLLPMRVADPAGGLPWGMRLVHTTRGLVCLQVGRIDGSRLGVLGQDGAFGDDGRFHPVAPDVVEFHRSTTEISSCLQPGQTISQEANIPQNGVFGARHPEAIPKSARRWISYGLLGPRAVSVSYTAEGHEHTLPVARGSGAYLVVLPGSPKGSFETGGGALSTTKFVTPQGAISSITYRVRGRLCSESRPANEASAHPQCPRPLVAARPQAPRRLNRPITVRLTAGGTATVTFKAPRAVASALSGYTVEIPIPCHEGTDGIPVERDVRAGEEVHVDIPSAFANACGHTITVRVVYEHDRERFPLGEDDLIVGETVVRR
jgi:hypothetical protein